MGLDAPPRIKSMPYLDGGSRARGRNPVVWYGFRGRDYEKCGLNT